MKITRTTGICLVVAMSLTGCGAIAEEVVEQAIEADTGEDVEIDFNSDDGTISIEGENGEEFSIDVDDNGSGSVMSGVDEDGNEFEIVTGQGVPDDWPSELPVPPGSVTSSTMMGDAGIQILNLTTEVDDAISAHDTYVEQLVSAGFTTGSTSSFESDGQTSKFTEVMRGEWTGMISSGADSADGPQQLVVSFQTTSE